MEDLRPYLVGERLYGDDFGPAELQQWYEDEREAYARLGPGTPTGDRYAYHSLNLYHGFRHLQGRHFRHVLGLGAAHGEELLPILPRTARLTIVDPSDAFTRRSIHGTPCTYVKPSVDGRLAFPAHSFDLITCLGVLHHIPNVTHIVAEMFRCLTVGGHALIREPIVSMGDWRTPRPGLTKRERGIPIRLLRGIVRRAGFTPVREAFCLFPAVSRVARLLGRPAYNSAGATRLDAYLSALFRWNIRYHAESFLQKLQPTAVFLVLRRDFAPRPDGMIGLRPEGPPP